ncbi:hypothetical protein R3P38DRAFT_3566357 [Favolaschia claudopus]|uniref:Homeobox domain-containing protein n=1 Tax=Favolaschia claudopus TaxID=2862362 RepID=A0AAW0DX18_9AGAR
MPSSNRARNTLSAEARTRGMDLSDFLSSGHYTTINGGTGGSGGGGGMHGGAGGNGEGPQFHISALETSWNILVNGSRSLFLNLEGRLHPSNTATDAHYHCNTLNHTSNPQELVVQREATPNVLVPILRRLSEYIEGDKEKALFVMYCTLFAILFPGSLKLTDRLRLVPLIALPFLVIPSILSLNDTITLVDVMGERRPVLLSVWKNQEAFIEKLRAFYNNNEKITAIIETDQYRIQDSKYSVYQLGSRMVSAGATLFMAAVFPCSQMSCPWCNTQIPVSPGRSLQAFIDWLVVFHRALTTEELLFMIFVRDSTDCKRRFSTSNSDSPAGSRNNNRSTAVYTPDNLPPPPPRIRTPTHASPQTSHSETTSKINKQTASSKLTFRFIHLLLLPISGRDAIPNLEHHFAHNPYPSDAGKANMAKLSGMSIGQIEAWFHNRRRRARRAGHHVHRDQSLPTTRIMLSANAEQYRVVAITGARNGASIRERIFSKLSIPDHSQFAFSVYQSEVGVFAIGGALTDSRLFELCREQGDSSGSLKFFVSTAPDRPPQYEFSHPEYDFP